MILTSNIKTLVINKAQLSVVDIYKKIMIISKLDKIEVNLLSSNLEQKPSDVIRIYTKINYSNAKMSNELNEY